MAKLSAASDAAREGSISALRAQQQRLTLEESPRLSLDEGLRPRALPPPKRASTLVLEDDHPLFCRYALELQFRPSKLLSGDFAPGGACRCPECDVRIDAASDDYWRIGKRVVGGREGGEVREFFLGQRFVVKCHTTGGEYACVLCSRGRERDAVCRSVEALAYHVGSFHEMEELEREGDLREVVPLGEGR